MEVHVDRVSGEPGELYVMLFFFFNREPVFTEAGIRIAKFLAYLISGIPGFFMRHMDFLGEKTVTMFSCGHDLLHKPKDDG